MGGVKTITTFRRVPSPGKVDAVLVMTLQQFKAYVMGGEEVWGQASPGVDGEYYWLHQGRWLLVEVVDLET